MKTLLFLLVFMVLNLVSCKQETRLDQRAPSWYVESFIHTHHSAGSPAPEWEDQFRVVRPDAVQFHVNAYSAGKDLAERYQFAMVATLNRSGGWDDVRRIVESLPEDEQKLFYRRVNPDGSPTGRMRDNRLWEHICYYSPGIDKHIIPLYEKVTEEFEPEQIWIDHTVITVNLCYCEVCVRQFSEQYGVAPPELVGDPRWDEWIAHHRRGFELWMEKVHDRVESVNPKTLVTFNHAYFLAQPEPPPPYVKNLSADIHGHVMNLCLFSRYATTVGLPFDLMPGLTDRWAGTIPKTEQEVVQVAAVITANGGRWNIGEFPMSFERQPAGEMLELARAGAELIRERQPWTHRTEAFPLVALLQSASTQYARVIPVPQYITGEEGEYVMSDNGMIVYMANDNPGYSRIYWNRSRSMPNEIFGAGAALLENNIPFDIINEATLKERLEEYKILIIGDQFRLDDQTISTIKRFVKRGGGLLVTGSTIKSGLAELLGVSLETDMPLKNGVVRLGNMDISVDEPLKINLSGAELVHAYSSNTQTPAITRHYYGKGRIFYVAGDFFKSYMDVSPYTPHSRSRKGNEAMRREVSDWIKEIAPGLGYSCKAPPWIEFALRQKEGKLLVQMVERTFEWRNDIYPYETPIELAISMKKRPGNVLLQPHNRKVEWKWENKTLHLTLPANEVKVHSILEIL